MHMLLVLAIALLTAAVVALAFFWLFRSDKLRRAAPRTRKSMQNFTAGMIRRNNPGSTTGATER